MNGPATTNFPSFAGLLMLVMWPSNNFARSSVLAVVLLPFFKDAKHVLHSVFIST
jgi:hypothetical protein